KEVRHVYIRESQPSDRRPDDFARQVGGSNLPWFPGVSGSRPSYRSGTQPGPDPAKAGEKSPVHRPELRRRVDADGLPRWQEPDPLVLHLLGYGDHRDLDAG